MQEVSQTKVENSRRLFGGGKTVGSCPCVSSRPVKVAGVGIIPKKLQMPPTQLGVLLDALTVYSITGTFTVPPDVHWSTVTKV